MCLSWIKNLIMADTKVHGGMDQNITTALQFTSQMSNYALATHAHPQYLMTAALSNHLHSQYLTTAQPVGAYLTTAALTNHLHNIYLNTSESGNIYFNNGNGISFGEVVSGNSTTITASVDKGVTAGNIVFLNSNGHTFGSSASAGSTFYWVKTS